MSTPINTVNAVQAEQPQPPVSAWVARLLLLLILLLGAAFRSLSLTDWDAGTGQHPDERFFADVASSVRLPANLTEFYDSARSPLNPRNYDKFSFFVYGPFPIIITRLTAVALTPPEVLPAEVPSLNGPPRLGADPGTPDQARTDYGPLVANPERALPRPPLLGSIFNPEGRNLTVYGEIQKVGRSLGLLFDLGTILLLYLIGTSLFDRRAGLLAALFGALTVLSIQQVHFFVDPIFSTFFCNLSLYWLVRAAQGRGWLAYALLGLSIGAAMANRITMATLGGLALVAALLVVLRRRHPAGSQAPPFGLLFGRELSLVVLAGALTLLSFRSLAPDAFSGSQPGGPLLSDHLTLLQGAGFLDLRFDPRFIENMSTVRGLVSGEIDFPPGQQWVGRTPYLFPWQNMVLWGMGPGLGLAAWLAWALFGLAGLRRLLWPRPGVPPPSPAWVLFSWISFYFLWQGGQFAINLRYLLPIYGSLIIFASWGLLHLFAWGRGARTTAAGRRRLTAAPLLLVVLLTFGWAYAFSRIYTRPHSRVTAAHWLAEHAPPGSAVTAEIWDDPLPLQVTAAAWEVTFQGISSPPYAEDELRKYVGAYNAAGLFEEGMLDQLDRADYITLTSNRVYDSTSRLRMRYPALMRYYHTLFSGELGFRLVAEVTSYPQILGLAIPDQSAEESFHVYDHPRVLIFEKTANYSRARAEALISENMLWDEVYKSPLLIADRNPTALRLTDSQWPRYLAGGTWTQLYNSAGWARWLAPFSWIGALQLLGLAVFALFFRLFKGLPDHGYSLAKVLALLLVAYLAWLGGSLGQDVGVPGQGLNEAISWEPFPLAFTPALLWLISAPLLAAGAAAAWFDRRRLRSFWFTRRQAIIGAEAVFFGFLLLGLSLRLLNPDLWHPARGGEKPMDFAYFNAVLKSAAFPPYDPWHAGGHLNYYYFGFVLVGTLTHLSTALPSVAYNLAVATLMGLTALGAWGVVYNLLAPQIMRTRRAAEWRAVVAAALAPGLLLLLGNLAQAVWYLTGYAAEQAAMGRSEWAYWDATRIVAGTVNEFPFFTFLFGDLHAHMLVMPLSLALLGLSVAYLRDPLHEAGRGRLTVIFRLAVYILLMGLLAGAIRATNTWDYPTFVGLAGLTMALAGWRSSRGRRPWPRIILWMLLPPLLLMVTGNLLFAPFTAAFATESSGAALWRDEAASGLLQQVLRAPRTTVGELIRLWGHWLALAAVAGLLLLARLAGKRVALIALISLGLLFAASLWLNWAAPLLLLPLLLLAVWLLWHLRRAPYRLLLPALWLSAGLGLGLLVEVLVVRGDIGRMNTVFKFGLHAWTLFALGSAALLPSVWQATGRYGAIMRYGLRAGLILVGVAALVYPLTATPARATDRWVADAPGGLDGTAFFSAVSAARQGPAFSLDEDAAAIAWLQANVSGTPVILEAHQPSYQWAGRVATFSGLPTILGWEWHQVQQRNAVGASATIARRQQIIAEIYNTFNSTTAAEWLRLYGVEYLYVGGVERSIYDPAGLAKFERMVADGQLAPVFSQGQTTIYRVLAPGQSRMLTSDLAVVAPEGTTPPPLLLATPVNQLPAVDEYAWNSLVRENWLLSTLLWLVLLYGLSLLGLPLAMLVFGGWRDSGLVWARLIGLLLLGYAVWLPTSLGLWFYNRWGVLGGLLIVLGLNLALLWWIGRQRQSGEATHERGQLARTEELDAGAGEHGQPAPDGATGGEGGQPARTEELAPDGATGDGGQLARMQGLAPIAAGLRLLALQLKTHRRGMLWSEGLFLAGFVLLALIRLANPDLWHPIWGGEKPMEFGFLNAILRSPVMPPYDPFFSDGIINYYYYGYFLISLPIKLSGSAPAVGFNLAVATLFGLTLAGVFALAAELTRRVRYGLLAALLVALLGNLAGFFAAGWSRGFPAVIAALADGGLPGFGARLGDWFIGPSRVIPYTINEFPFFSFLFADLHPHLIAMPITLLVVALAYALVRLPGGLLARGFWPPALLLALSLGTLAVTNSWDFPSYGLLTGLALLGAAWRAAGRRASGLPLAALLRAGGLAAGLGLTGLALYAPFFDRYWAPVGGIGQVTTPTLPGDYLVIYGLTVAVLVPLLIAALGRVFVPRRHFSGMVSTPAILALHNSPTVPRGLLAVAALALGLFLSLALPWLGLRAALALLLLASLPVLLRRALSPTTWYALLLAWLGWAVALGAELLYVRDHLDGSDWYRMNTVFKFGLQSWLLLNLAAAALLPTLLHGLRRAGGLWAQRIALGGLGLLVALAAIYPLAGVPSRIANRFEVATGPTLDGLAFLEQASFSYDCAAYGGCEPGAGTPTIDLSGDAAAIDWLNRTISGTPIVVQSNLAFYRGYGIRIAANTGLPTVISALHVNEQRDPAAAARRDADLDRFYRSPDPEEALRFLASYRVDYVYVGGVERAIYPATGLAKFEQMRGNYLEPVFDNQQVQIYAVKGVPSSYARPAPVAFSTGTARPTPVPPVVAPPDLADLEQANLADPTIGAIAFGLAERYREMGRIADALRILEPAAQANPNDIGLHHLWGDILALAGRFDEAERAYLLAAQAQPTAENWNKLGVALLDWGAFDKAELALERAVAANPALPAPHYQLGRLFALTGEAERARAELELYLNLDPNGQWAAQARQLLVELNP